MFNQPHPARAAVPWQPNAGIAKKLSSRGYATTRWGSEEPEPFADLGYPAKSSGFSADHYQPVRQPLTQQAMASLALLEDAYRNESLGEEKPESQTSTATNEHLPFVMDQFAATRKSKLRVNVDPGVLQRALAQAELAETLKVSPITPAEEVADPIVIHPDVPDEVPLATQDAQDAPDAQEASVQTDPVDEEASPMAMATVEEALIETQAPSEPELPAVVGGIAPEEVVRREDEKFAEGLMQGREEGAAALAQAVEQAKAEALAQGLEQGKSEGLAEGLQQGLEQGKAQGLAEGEQTAREAVAAEMAAQRVVFENAAHELQALLKDSTKFFEPLKRLALHIAEQVVMGELQTSTKALERLVQRCLDELNHPVQGAVVLELHPDDKVRLQTQATDLIQGMRLEAVHDMQPGSVRVFANDTVVEDLVENRLTAMARALHVDEAAWLERSVLTHPVVQEAPEEKIVEEKTEHTEEVEDGDVHS
ncbi:MAG: FliH/SctL family protein [Limnohabitans sp.]